jgi:hypothetical protein
VLGAARRNILDLLLNISFTYLEVFSPGFVDFASAFLCFLFEFFFLADTGAFFERFLVRSHLWICVCGYFSFFFRGNLV